MNWAELIKRTAVRRVVWIVVGIVVYALLGLIGKAHAQSIDISSAYSQCLSSMSERLPPYVIGQPCHLVDYNGRSPGAWRYFYGVPSNPMSTPMTFQFLSGCPVGEWRDDLKQCVQSCSSRPELSTPPPFQPAGIQWRNGAQQCNNGCMVGYVHDNEVGSWFGVHTGQQCTGNGLPDGGCEGVQTGGVDYQNSVWGCVPPPSDCKPNETRDPATGACGLGCPAGQILTGHGECQPEKPSCPPGQTKAPDGSCLPAENACPAGQALGGDGTCKRDSNNDGVPDEDEPDGDGTNKDGMEFSGGDSCQAPPACSGDAIMCGQARIQWRIDCNTRRAANVTGGTCEAMPICVGEHCDPVEYAQLIQQWRTACALAKIADGGGILGGGDGDGGTAVFDAAAVGEAAADGASGTVGDGGDPSGAFTDGSEGGGGDGTLDTSGLGFGNSCPALPSINVLGVTLDFNTVGPDLCNWMTLAGHIVLILSSLVSLRILAGGMNV